MTTAIEFGASARRATGGGSGPEVNVPDGSPVLEGRSLLLRALQLILWFMSRSGRMTFWDVQPRS